jgi:hypothetical protein
MSGGEPAGPVGTAGDFDYEVLGSQYSRKADPRIAHLVRSGLGTATRVVNTGAGAGSYEPPDLLVTAVEPSASMRSQRLPDGAPALNAVAENLPFPDECFDAAMVTVHQWSDADRGLRELRRVSRGPVVILTFDGDALDKFWLANYVPELIAAERRRYPAIDHMRDVLGGSSTVTAVPIPIDCTDGCTDGFTEAFYARPEGFLDPAVRHRNRPGDSFHPRLSKVPSNGCARTLTAANGIESTDDCERYRSFTDHFGSSSPRASPVGWRPGLVGAGLER